jgi:hypothetical protein
MSSSKRLIDVTLDELVEELVPKVTDAVMRRINPTDERLYGRAGIMEAFHCSGTKAGQIRKVIADVCRPEASKQGFSFLKDEAIRTYLARQC